MNNLIAKLIAKHKKDITMLDSLLQWSITPSAEYVGYGIDVNYQYIRENLRITYELTQLEAEKRVELLKKLVDELQKEESEIGKLREIIKSEITEKYFDSYLKLIKKQLQTTDEGVLNILSIYKYDPSSSDNYYYLQAQHDAIFGKAVKEQYLVKSGILKFLYWLKGGSSAKNSEVIPVLIPFLDRIVENVKLKKLSTKLSAKVDVTKFVRTLTDFKNKFKLDFLEKKMNQISYYQENKSLLREEGIIGVFKRGAAISYLIKKSLFESIQKIIDEINKSKTEKVIMLLEYEVENKRIPTDMEIIRVAKINIDELDEYKQILFELPPESQSEDEEIIKKATKAIQEFNEPYLIDLVKTLNFDIITARKVLRYLLDKGLIKEWFRTYTQETPKDQITSDKPKCGDCGCKLDDRENPEFCPFCGSSNL